MISLLVAKARSNESTTSFVKVAIPHSRGGNEPMNRVRGTETTASVSEGLPTNQDLQTPAGSEKALLYRRAKPAATPCNGRTIYTRRPRYDKPVQAAGRLRPVGAFPAF